MKKVLNWPAFYYGFQLLGTAALVVVLGLVAAANDYERQALVRSLFFYFFILYIINVVVAAVRKQLPQPLQEVVLPEEPEEAERETQNN